MRDIDWQAVHWVVTEGCPLKLHTAERRMAMRRLADKMLKNTDSPYAQKLTAYEVARRLQITDRSVIRYLAEMSPGEKKVCPVCREDMWVVDGVVLACLGVIGYGAVDYVEARQVERWQAGRDQVWARRERRHLSVVDDQ
jgi:hypothetical protein